MVGYQTADHLYFITVTLWDGSACIHETTYFFSTAPGPHPLRNLMLPTAAPDVRITGGQTIVTNRSERAALYIHQDDCGVFTLFPGECRVFDGEYQDFCAANQLVEPHKES